MILNLPPGLSVKAKIKYLVENKSEIVEATKFQCKEADCVAFESYHASHLHNFGTIDKTKLLYENDIEAGILKRTIVANTYNWLDTHEDVHLNGLFGKSIAERGKRVPHLYDHKESITAKIGRPLQFYEKEIKWRALGHPKNGDTMALIMESSIEKDLNPYIYREYLTDSIDQHSVKMQYVKIDLAVNDENYTNEFKTWQEVYPNLGNKERADSLGYFWAVSEAKLIEVSAVLYGSNELTPTLDNKSEPPLGTRKIEEPPLDTPKLDVNKILEMYYPKL